RVSRIRVVPREPAVEAMLGVGERRRHAEPGRPETHRADRDEQRLHRLEAGVQIREPARHELPAGERCERSLVLPHRGSEHRPAPVYACPHGGHAGHADGACAARAAAERPHHRPPRGHPGLRRAARPRGRRPQLGGRHPLRRRRRDRPDRRLARAPLARPVRVREVRGPARRPAADRRRGRAALRRGPASVGGARRDHRARPAPDRRRAVRDAARLRLLGEPARQGRDVGALRGGRLRHRDAPEHRVAARPLLGGPRPRLPRRGRLLPLRLESGTEMRAVVMAGGEGTRLRPLTSNQPKPMVPIVGKPCMEHILELLRRHGFDEVVVTVAFLPQAIRTYFGDGDWLGLSVEYSVEESPLGTAGSVRLASDRLDETFVVISGDALCDIDLTKLLEFHREKGAAVTIGLKSVENPLEFGIVVTDEDGRIERFLEKPSWGQVFSDTINTGIYVIEPEVLRHVPTDRPYDFSKELFPLLLEMGRPLYGYVCDGYWQDIGNLDQYRQANFDALERRVELEIPGIRIRGNVWIGEAVQIDALEGVERPAFIGNYCRISPHASVGPYSVLSASVTLRERARTVRSVIDQSTYIGRSSVVEGAILGRSCDVRAHVRIHEGAAIGDEVVLGAESLVMPGVRIYPFKEVESGAQIHESLIWESRASSRLFGKDGVTGLVNVDLTPESAVRLAASFGTALKRGARVVASRESPSACRLIKRAMISGLNSTGVHVADLRVLPATVSRHLLKTHGYDAGFHVG